MNEEQVKSGVRWFVATFGGLIVGYVTAKGWISADQATTILNSSAFVGAIASIIVGVWGLFVHSKTNAVAVVNAMPEVKGVVTQPTQAGLALAQAIPSETVVPAGTNAAARVAAT